MNQNTKHFFCREWAFAKLAHCLDNRPSSKTCGALIVGGPGCGKTALCTELVWPSSSGGRQTQLNSRLLAYHFCQAHDIDTLSVCRFVLSMVRQLSQSELLAGYQDRLRDAEVQTALNPSECERNPDEAFKKAVLFPLLEIEQPSQTCYVLVDSIDESLFVQPAGEKPNTLGHGPHSVHLPMPGGSSRTIAELLAAHHQLFPQWLLLVCSARKQSKTVTRMFTGFRKISLDDLRKAHVVRDVQQYILSRLDREEPLRQHLSRETAEMLNQLHIKSNGCFLYLERVLDGVADNFIMLREIREIPGTLNGLYLWLCQRLFVRKQFAKVQPLLNVILATRKPLSPEKIFQCVWTRNTLLTAEDFRKRMTLLNKVLVDGPGGTTKLLFHHSFAEWLLDVKHCTQKYLCQAGEGHAMLALRYTLKGPDLTPLELQDLAHHLNKIPALSQELEPFHLPLWLVLAGSPLESAFAPVGTTPRDHRVVKLLMDAGASPPEQDRGDEDVKKVVNEPTYDCVDPLEALLAEGGSVDQVDNNQRTMLHTAAYEGDKDLLVRLIDKGADLEAIDKNGQTPLNLAARQGHNYLVEELLKVGANPDHADNDGWTPLRSSAWAGHIEVVDVLLKNGAQVDLADSDQRTALRAASWGGHEEIVSRLLASGADVNRADKEGRTALIAAAYMGHAEIVEHLLDHGADINHADSDGRTALSVAALCVPASKGHAGVVSLLLERGAEVDHRDREGMTPLLVAAFEGHGEVCELLLEGEADVDHTDNSGRTPLFAAASMGHSFVVNLLLFWGAAVDSIDAEGRTVLSIAAAQGNVEVVRQLLDRGLDELHRDNVGWTPLHYAAFEGHVEVCILLLEAGARPCEVDNDGRIPLILAAQEGHSGLVQALLEHGPASLVDHKSHDGKTAFRVAALEGHKDTVHILASYNADVNYQDADGRSTLYLIALEGRADMADFLLARGADPEATDLEGRTPLHVAAWQGHIQVVDLLLSRGAKVDAQDHDQRTALQSASWQGHSHIVKHLLERGAKVDHACSQGATALGIAAQEGHEEVVRVLLEHGADPTHVDQCGRNPLRVAMKAGHALVVKLLEEYMALGRTGSASTTSLTSASTAETKPCSAVLCPFESPESTVDKRRSFVSNQSSSKSSSNLTNSTTKSSQQQHQAQQRSQQTHHSTQQSQSNSIECNLTFTQQIQQCTRSRHRGSRILSPLSSEPHSPMASPPQSPMSEVQRLSPVCDPSPQQPHYPMLIQAPRRGPLPELPRQSQQQDSGRFRRNGIVTNPNYKGNKSRETSVTNQLRNKHYSNYEESFKNSGIPLKKETPL